MLSPCEGIEVKPAASRRPGSERWLKREAMQQVQTRLLCCCHGILRTLIKMLRNLTIVSMQQITLPESAHLLCSLQNEE